MRSLARLVYRLAAIGGFLSVASAFAMLLLHRRARLRGWARRLLTVGLVWGLVLGTASVGAAAWRSYSVRRLLNASARVNVDTLRADRPPLEPVNFLVLGSDARDIPGYANDDPNGPVEGQRADVLMVLKVDPASGRAVVLSIPRDFYVQIPSHGPTKINAALELGGPSLQVSVVQDLTGIPIDHYVEVDFSGFVDIVNTMGGVQLCVDHPMRDQFTGIDLGTAGCHNLDGIGALSFVRSRHAEYQIDGRWVDDPDGDLGRIRRQQDFLEELMKKAFSTGATRRVPEYASAVGRALTFDSAFSSDDVVNLVQGFSRPTPEAVAFLSLPGTTDDLDGVSYVFPKEPDADQVLVSIGGRPIPDTSLPFGRD